ncbi:hypothetical protein K0M31_018685 [Melipona bicolor]|uniref:Uncharacterized protein n=1 Tax=Melipona bicolor TaxID=60889 RepID=A0AA40G4I4_9HYME|nr:hypothetical protein K0M31_018685 [Melipona bicolor]
MKRWRMTLNLPSDLRFDSKTSSAECHDKENLDESPEISGPSNVASQVPRNGDSTVKKRDGKSVDRTTLKAVQEIFRSICLLS